MDTETLFRRLMAEASAAVEDAATLAADLQVLRQSAEDRQPLLLGLQALALDGSALSRACARLFQEPDTSFSDSPGLLIAQIGLDFCSDWSGNAYSGGR